MSAVVNAALDPLAVAAPCGDATHSIAHCPATARRRSISSPGIAEQLGLAAVHVKDESDRLVLPAFKILGRHGRSSARCAPRRARTRSSRQAQATTVVR
jgi:diaminopropionate ammonia-lyase